jgi:hypothetical protein
VRADTLRPVVTDSRVAWTVVGAGPAGLATVALLLDGGVDGRQIAWIDPHFSVGDFGTSWRHVLSNTPVSHFLKFYRHSQAFQAGIVNRPLFIERLPEHAPCILDMAAEPLRQISVHLQRQVHALSDSVRRLSKRGETWAVSLASGPVLTSTNVVLAIGAEPKRLDIAGPVEIALATALQPTALAASVTTADHVAVFGDAQSARSVLRNLSHLNAARVFHFYHSRHAVERHLPAEETAFATSLPASPSHLIDIMPGCSKVIYAIGFRRRLLHVDGLPSDFGYDHATGVIAPGLFGLGLAFPEVRPHEMGQAQYKVAALWPTMKRLRRCLPLWMGVGDARGSVEFDDDEALY